VGGGGDANGNGPGRSGGDGRPPVPGVVVDPRMRSRRIDVRREAGRRRLRRLVMMATAASVLTGAAYATQTPLLDVDRIAVVGAEHTSADEVRRAASIARGDALISVDGGAVARRVEELPWVASVDVERSWPSTLTVRVTEREPVALVQVSEDRAAAVDAEGWVVAIEPHQEGAGDTLVLTGIEDDVAEGGRLGREARAALTVAVAVAERLPDVVAAVSTELDAELREGGTVRFGSTDDLGAKVTALETVLDEVDTSCLQLLDVRVAGSPALTRNQGCS
jgi:cell division protein FtsQ